MSRQLSIEYVKEQLQQVLHNLVDLSSLAPPHAPFKGVVFEGLEFVYRDQGVSRWTITIEPYSVVGPLPLSAEVSDVGDDGPAQEPGVEGDEENTDSER